MMVLTKPQSLSLPEYALKARQSNRFENAPDEFDNLRFGYFGEVGGLLASVKKSGRDQLTEPQSQMAAEELGDALWYFVSMATLLKVTPDELGSQCIKSLRHRLGESDRPVSEPVSFGQIDGLILTHKEGWDLTRVGQLGMLALSAGNLANRTLTSLEAMSPPSLREHLGNLLSEWALACGCFSLSVEDIARANLAKISSRWPGQDHTYPSFFDPESEFPAHERFERTFEIEFVERGGYVVQSLNGVFVGDRLTDNSNEPDDYRFHDVFHLAYIAFLGWSPVVRGLLKRKRKSNPAVDENEDGARAMIIEEGIATWIFNHAKRFDFYKDLTVGKLDYSLLKQIQSMIEGYEVSTCMLWQWELAILRGFEVFRQLRQHRGGIVTVDMEAHELSFRPSSTTVSQ